MVSVNLPDELVEQAKIYAAVQSRSVPKQIEHWARIGQIATDNPDLSYDFIQEIMLAELEKPVAFDLSELDE
jgi:hypothetical protein